MAAAFPKTTFFDPTTLNELPAAEAARREIEWIRDSDVCLFFFREGQKGRCSAFEMGTAHALGKPIIYVDDRLDPWIAEFAFSSTDLGEAITHLGGLIHAGGGDDISAPDGRKP